MPAPTRAPRDPIVEGILGGVKAVLACAALFVVAILLLWRGWGRDPFGIFGGERAAASAAGSATASSASPDSHRDRSTAPDAAPSGKPANTEDGLSASARDGGAPQQLQPPQSLPAPAPASPDETPDRDDGEAAPESAPTVQDEAAVPGEPKLENPSAPGDALPNVAGLWQEAPGVGVEISQRGRRITAATTYYHANFGAVRWIAHGTISAAGEIKLNLRHLQPPHFRTQERAAVLSADRRTIQGKSHWEGGDHDFTWTQTCESADAGCGLATGQGRRGCRSLPVDV
ncbi:MAG: hypothetical protein KY475_22595 [Planctomycetes bacterium]|nr:hypothetical protein [Planctomycetota bacterium]